MILFSSNRAAMHTDIKSITRQQFWPLVVQNGFRLKCPVISLNKSIQACLNHLFASKKAAALSTCVCVCAYLSRICSTLKVRPFVLLTIRKGADPTKYGAKETSVT